MHQVSAPAPSLLQSWEPRCKLIALAALALSFAAVNELHLVPPILAAACGLAALSGLGPGFFLRRLRYPSLFLLGLLFFLPLAAGQEVILIAGPLALHREGLVAAALIGGRFLAIIITALALLHTTALQANLQALRALGLPWIMVDLSLLVVRYLQVLRHDLERTRIAMRCRGWQEKRFDLRQLRLIAWLTGSLLVRSLARSDGIYRAMRLRGYGQSPNSGPRQKAGPRDLLLLLLSLAFSFGVTWLNVNGHGALPLAAIGPKHGPEYALPSRLPQPAAPVNHAPATSATDHRRKVS